MAIYKHVSGVIKEVPDESPAAGVYEGSPSWKKITPEETNNSKGIYADLSKEDLTNLARQRLIEVSKHHTKDEIIERIESRDGQTPELEVVFTDNLIIE